MERTFTWTDGTQVLWIDDTDEWTSAELRQVEALAGGTMASLSQTSVAGLMICVSVARATGQRIAEVDRALTFGAIRRIREEMAAKDQEAADRAAEAAAAEAAEAADAPPLNGRVVEFTGTATIPVAGADGEDGEVLSPTSAGSEQPPA